MSDVQRPSVALADRYAVEHELGRGGMATVRLARDIKHERDVAIKVQLAPRTVGESAETLLYYVMPLVGRRIRGDARVPALASKLGGRAFKR